jgi:tRNA(Arg) A34 adenosine deaminase TadA
MGDQLTKTIRNILLAKKVAELSDYGKFRHGAVLVKGNSVRNMACNKHRHCHFGKRFREANTGTATLHAELGVILGMDRSITQGATVYVARVNKEGTARMSKPCPMCENAMRHVGIKRVIYTDRNGRIETMTL